MLFPFFLILLADYDFFFIGSFAIAYWENFANFIASGCISCLLITALYQLTVLVLPFI